MQSILALYFLLFIASLSLCAQPGNAFRIEHIGAREGLSQGMINDIEQTDDGFLWVATKDGLNRYDGYRFEVFTNDPFNPFSIAGNNIGWLFEDGRGNLWMGIGDQGMDVMEKTSGKFLHLPMPELGRPQGEIQITESSDGSIRAKTSDRTWLFQWKNASDALLGGGFESPDLLKHVTISQEDKAPETKPPLDPSESASIFSDGAGHRYRLVGSHIKTEIYALSDKEKQGTSTLIYTADVSSSAIMIDRSDNLWIGTSGYGLRKINLARQPFRHFLKGKTVGRIFATDAIYAGLHLIWESFGQLDEASGNVIPFSPALSVSNYFLAKNGVTYTLTIANELGKNDLLILKNGSLEKLRIDSLYSLNHIYTSMVEDPAGDIWISGGDCVLMRFQPTTGEMRFFHLSQQFGSGANIYALHFDAKENLWIGTSNGMAKVPIAALKTAKSSAEIPADQFKIFQNDPANLRSLRYNFVTHFCPDPLEPERYLWVSTKGGGLNLLDKTTNKFQHFNSRNSDLPNDVVYGILPDGAGNLWMSTNRGLSRLTVGGERQTVDGSSTQPPVHRSPSTAHRFYRFRNFRASDGLQDDEFNTASFARSNDGRLFFGGVNGLTAFYPSEIKGGQTDAPVRLTGLKINNTPVSPLEGESPLDRPLPQTESIRLKYTENLLTLEFALLDFQNPSENRFRYRLKGVDPDWVEAGTSHVANYAHLRPGTYLFEVQGSVSGGSWSDPASLRITVLPPWWATWWAYACYLLTAAVAAWWLMRFRARRRALEHQLKMEHLEAARLKEMDDFKSRFFTNITHEFRTPLTVILGMAEQWMADGGRWTESETKSKVGLIKRNGENLLRLINQILDLAKLESNALKLDYVQGDVLPYLRYITESLQSLANAQNVMLRVESTEAQIVMDYDPERLLQIIHNLLSNAVKFTPSGGRVTLSVGIREEGRGMQSGANLSLAAHQSFLFLTVRDNGVGIPAGALPKIFDRFYQFENQEHAKAGGSGIGLSLTKELVRAMGGEISVESEVGKGTTFTVRLPVAQSPNTPPHTLPLTPKGEPKMGNSEVIFSENTVDLDGLGSPLGVRGRVWGGVGGLSHEAKPSILLIEDNPDVVEYLVACFTENYRLDFAYNGRSGIEKAMEIVPDLIVSDVMMPEKDGFEVCETLKNDERTSHIPIILLTARADAASRIAGLRRGADAYLSKPFNKEEMIAQLQVLFENKQRMKTHFYKSMLSGTALPLDDSDISGAIEIEDVFIKKVKAVIEANYKDEDFSLPQLCQKIGMSRSQLFRKMKAVTDTAPSDLIRSYRLNKAKILLEKEGLNVAEAAYAVGFKDPSYFSKLFQEEFGFQPSATNK